MPGLSSKLADRPPLQRATKVSHSGLHLRISENARQQTVDSSTPNFIAEETQAQRVKGPLQNRGQNHASCLPGQAVSNTASPNADFQK